MENIQSFELLLFVGGFALTAGQILNWQLGSSKYFHILSLRDFGDLSGMLLLTLPCILLKNSQILLMKGLTSYLNHLIISNFVP